MALAAAHPPRLADDLQIGGQELGPRVAGAVRLQPVDLGQQARRQGAQRDLGVEGQRRGGRAGREVADGVLAELFAETVDAIGLDAEAGRRRVAAVAEQVLAAMGQGLVQGKAGDRSAAAGAGAVRVGRRSISTGRPNCSASRPATMPITPACQSPPAAPVPGRRGAGRRRPCSRAWATILRSICCRCWFCDFEIGGQVLGPLRRWRREQFDHQPGAAEPAGGVESRGQLERHVLGPDRLACQAGGFQQRRQADRRLLAEPPQAVADEDAVLVVQRHHVGDQAERGEGDGIEQELPQLRRDLLAALGPLARAARRP